LQEDFEFVVSAHGGNWSRVDALDVVSAWLESPLPADSTAHHDDGLAHDTSAAGLGLSPPHELLAEL
jgi:hypothetical protein